MSYLGPISTNAYPVINYISNGRAIDNTLGWNTYAESDAVTFQDTGDTVTLNNHGLSNNAEISFTSITSTTGISINTRYFVVNATTNTFQVATSAGGSALPLTTNGSGTMVRFVPKTGSGGSANITWNRDLTSPLRGIADFTLVKDAVNRQGQGVSVDFTINNADLAKVLNISFDYELISGTYATGDLAVYLIQDPAGTPVVIQPAGYQVQSASTGTKTKQIATFQTASNVTSYRLCIHVASVSASAYTLAFDNFVVGPQTVQYGAPVTDWQSYNLTIGAVTTAPTTGTILVNEARWRRVGDSVEIYYSLRTSTGGTAGSGAYLFPLPSGLSVDTTKMSPAGAGSSGAISVVGPAAVERGGLIAEGTAILYSSTQIALQVLTDTLAPAFVGNLYALDQAVKYTFRAIVPIASWSSAVQMSNDTDTRVVAARYYQETNTAQSTYLDFPTKEIDTHNAVTTGSGVWKFTCPVPGFYKVSCRYSGAASAIIRLYKNGALFPSSNAAVILDANPTNGNGAGSTLVQLNAGDYIQLNTSNNALMNAHVSIERLSGPSAIAASETVAARYSTAAGQAITGGAVTLVNFGTADYDSHGAVTTGAAWKFTAPISGKYRITSCLASGAFTSSAGNRWTLQLYKNGVSHSRLGMRRFDASLATNADVTGSGTISLLAGDYIDVRVDSSLNSVSLATDAGSNWIAVERVGN